MARTLAAVPVLTGFLILTAWALDIESIQRLGLASVSMNPVTAACFVALGVGALVRRLRPNSAPIAFGLWAVVAGVGATKLFDIFAGTGIDIDAVLFSSALDASRWFPNRMAPNTALCFLLIGFAAVLSSQRPLAAVVLGQILAIVTGTIALFALLGYVYGVAAFYNVPAFIPMAVHTAVCFLSISGVVLAIAPNRGVMAPILDHGVAGRSARKLLPAAIIGPFVLGLLRLEGERIGLVPGEIGVSLMITSTMLLLAIVIWWNSTNLLSVDQKRLNAEASLRSLNEDLEGQVHARTAEAEGNRRFLGAVLGHMQDALFVNRGGRIVFVNDACTRLFGAASIQDVLGRSPLDFFHGADHAVVLERIKTLNRAPTQVPPIEERVVRLDGQVVEVEVAAASFIDHGEVVILAMLRDLTSRKAMERQLQHAQRLDAVGQLTGGIAHDFNNLLAVVIGNLELLESEIRDRPAARALSETALKAGLRGAELTRQLLAFSRRQSLEAKSIDVNAVVSETTALLRRTLGEKITLRVQLQDALWPALADAAQVESALANLAINARDAMVDGGTLTFETANKCLDDAYAAANVDVMPGDYVMVAVTDTGTGIPEQILGKVFEPFFTTKSEGKGSGLGLSMIYGFAKQSRGHVKIYSEVGHGTTVRLYLPRSATAPDAKSGREIAHAIVRNDATILVVEDDSDVRRTTVGQLAQLGYKVVEAENARAALDMLRQQPVDLMFSDVVMPGGMTGIELAVEAARLQPEVKVLLTSGFAEGSINGRASNFPLLSKPYRKQDLERKVHEILQEEVA